jgi:hypothetical protein
MKHEPVRPQPKTADCTDMIAFVNVLEMLIVVVDVK